MASVRASDSVGAQPPVDSVGPVRVTSRELLQDRAELIIVHEGREYRLRVTQNGKLILTA